MGSITIPHMWFPVLHHVDLDMKCTPFSNARSFPHMQKVCMCSRLNGKLGGNEEGTHIMQFAGHLTLY